LVFCAQAKQEVYAKKISRRYKVHNTLFQIFSDKLVLASGSSSWQQKTGKKKQLTKSSFQLHFLENAYLISLPL
jgi:hypothetical protein